MKEAKKLATKYPNIKNDFLELKSVLKKTPEKFGIDIGGGMYKIRMSISDKQRGKSGSARVIVYILRADKEVYVLSVYDKAQYDTVVVSELKKAVKALKG
jgi:hypothetical protein